MKPGAAYREELYKIQARLRAENPDLRLMLTGQAHYGVHDLAFVDVLGCDETERRRALRARAVALLAELGCRVDLIPGKDVYSVNPAEP